MKWGFTTTYYVNIETGEQIKNNEIHNYRKLKKTKYARQNKDYSKRWWEITWQCGRIRAKQQELPFNKKDTNRK